MHKNYFSPLFALTQYFILGQIKEKTSFFRTRACKSALRIKLFVRTYSFGFITHVPIFYLYARKPKSARIAQHGFSSLAPIQLTLGFRENSPKKGIFPSASILNDLLIQPQEQLGNLPPWN